MRVLSLAIALAACGATPQPTPVIAPPVPMAVVVPPPPPDAAVDAELTGIAAALAKLTELTEAMCRCSDAGCANRLAAEGRAWRNAHDPVDGDSELSEAQHAQLRELGKRLSACMTDAMTSPASGSPP